MGADPGPPPPPPPPPPSPSLLPPIILELEYYYSSTDYSTRAQLFLYKNTAILILEYDNSNMRILLFYARTPPIHHSTHNYTRNKHLGTHTHTPTHKHTDTHARTHAHKHTHGALHPAPPTFASHRLLPILNFVPHERNATRLLGTRSRQGVRRGSMRVCPSSSTSNMP